jgi:arylformamidase
MQLDLESARIVDLSPAIDPGWMGPATAGQGVEVFVHAKPVPEGTHWQGTTIKMYTHTGSHIDALIHCREDGWTTDSIKLEQVIGEGVVLDFSSKDASEPIEVAEIAKYDSVIRPGDIVLIRTDWSDEHWGTDRFFGDSPYMARESVEWLLAKNPKLVGFDFTEDYCIRDRNYDPRELYCHQLFMGAGIPIMEQLVNLRSLPIGERFLVMAPFIKLTGSDGVMARVFAFVPASSPEGGVT